MLRRWTIALLLLLPGLASAHEVGLSRGHYEIEGNILHARLAFSRKEIRALDERIDQNGDDALSAEELEAAQPILAKKIFSETKVRSGTSSGTSSCAPSLSSTSLAEEDGLMVIGKFTCKDMGDVVTVRASFVRTLSNGHRHIVQAIGPSSPINTTIFAARPSFGIPAKAGVKTGSKSSLLIDLFGEGIVHILFGFDHLVFLLGVIIIGGRMRSMIVVITAFTVGHSVTLGLASLNVWAPSGSIIEPMIAASIVYVGVENFFVKDLAKRWYITGLFGLIHGFGFAGALAEIGLPKGFVVPSLLVFNLGVEAGQILVLVAVIPLLVVLRRQSWFETKGVGAVNIAIILLGALWFIQRVFF